jgi:hypothetical protein
MSAGKYLSVFTASVFVFLTVASLSVSAEVVIMPVGDSITKGSNSGAVPDQEAFYVSYRQYLLDKLIDESYDVNFVGSQDAGFGVAGFDDSEHEGHGGFHAAGEPNGDNILPNVQDWLIDQQNDGFPTGIVLLHIGTNDISNDGEDANEIEGILDEIEQYDPNTVVCLARIINRLDAKSQATTDFNESVQLMVDNRIDPPVVVDMENAAGIIYDFESNGGDMNDDIHPFETGYEKMAEAWFNVCLQNVLPRADAGPDQDADEGFVVTLDGSGSLDPRGGNLFYLWEQTNGSAVTLSDDRAVMPTFTAPDVGSGGDTLTFKLTVTEETLLLESAADTTGVKVSNPSSGGGGGGGGGGCFIATAAYGSPMEFHVMIFREFREHFLLTDSPGKTFVNFYYTHSPPLAELISDHDWLRAVARWSLLPLVGMSWMTLHIGPFITLTLFTTLVIFAVFVLRAKIVCKKKHRIKQNASSLLQ